MCEETVAARVTLVPRPSAPREAKAFLLSNLCKTHHPTTRDDAALLLTELVTNAVNYGLGTPIRVDVECDARVGNVISVHDGNPAGELTALHPGPDATGGRGLLLVELLSDNWGVAAEPSGKTVWFRLAAPV